MTLHQNEKDFNARRSPSSIKHDYERPKSLELNNRQPCSAYLGPDSFPTCFNSNLFSQNNRDRCTRGNGDMSSIYRLDYSCCYNCLDSSRK